MIINDRGVQSAVSGSEAGLRGQQDVTLLWPASLAPPPAPAAFRHMSHVLLREAGLIQ